jgi:hypothetical protein
VGVHTTAEIIAKDVSSPQTVHINAHKRAPTLMMWVHVGMVESAVFLAIAAVIDRKHAMAFVAGGLLEMAVTECEYLYARNRGVQERGLPVTEQYEGQVNYG